MRRRAAIAALFMSALAAAGCASGIGAPSIVYRAYHPLSSVGYRDKQVGDGLWEVTYATDVTDQKSYYRRYSIYRAAEIARAAGFPYFHIVRQHGYFRPILRDAQITLTVRGVHSATEPIQCEQRSASECSAYSTEEALRQFEPEKRQPPRTLAPPRERGMGTEPG